MSTPSAPDTTEFERMLRCESYHAGDPYIRKIADEQAVILDKINAEPDVARRSALLKNFFKVEGDEAEKKKARVVIVPPFFCEYVSALRELCDGTNVVVTLQGFNITIGGDLFIHKGCTILDVGPGA
ncbi:hypothetical protein BDN71DRAFT_531827 [Pleurotus eryngii]|uniref:Maltose/galactoside acetyltransferase domain-containing protein n=1 Tax=Pleurotus eryngii TaxID=5323 RepID=A0A9P6A0S0_PLEER|nr:hypothetical protein BDN71DRAFT_531827 [Pleurotus eryngii]